MKNLEVLTDNLLSNRFKFSDALNRRSESLSKFLPYRDYLDEFKIFVASDGSLGVILEVELLDHEPMASREILSHVQGFKSLLSLPENYVLQVLYEQSAISKRDRIWQELLSTYPNAHPVSQAIFGEKIKMIRDDLSPLKRSALVSIRYFPPQQRVVGWKMAMARGEKILWNEMSHFVREAKSFVQVINQYQENAKVSLKILDAQQLIDYLRRFFNPKEFHRRDFAPWNKHLCLSQQIIFNSPTLSYQGIEREGVKTRTITLKTTPQFAYPGGMAYFTKLTFPYKLSLNFSFPSKSKVKRFFDLKEFFLEKSVAGKAKIQKEEVKQAQDRLAAGERCLHLTFCIIIEGETEEILDQRTRELVNIFHNRLECEVIVEDEIGLGLALNTLPLNYSSEADFSSGRSVRILQNDAVMFLPLFDSYKGLKNPLQVYLSREKNLVYFNLQENQTSNHTVVLGDSGSGKSGFVIDCMQASKRMHPEPLVFVIDKKSSYKAAVGPFKGELTVFGDENEMPFNPFRGIFDDAKVNFLTRLLTTGIKLTSPNFDIESEHIAVISKALKLAYLSKLKTAGLAYTDGELVSTGEGEEVEIIMDDFVASMAALTGDLDVGSEFESMSSSIEELLRKLKPFYGDGNYARYFGGSKKSDSTSRVNISDCLLYVYDLDALKDKTLQTLMAMSVIEEIRTLIARHEHQQRGGFIVIEELGIFGRDNPIVGDFIVDAAETFRKLGFWLIGIAPRPQNFFESQAGKALWGVADNFIIMRMSSDNVDYLQAHSQQFNEAHAQMIKSLKVTAGACIEFFFMNKDKSRAGISCCYRTPSDRWLAVTNKEDSAIWEQTTKELGGDDVKAFNRLAFGKKEKGGKY